MNLFTDIIVGDAEEEDGMETGKTERKRLTLPISDRRALRDRGYLGGELLGRGAFSEVYRAEGKDGKTYACKISGNGELLEKEARILEKLRHPLFPAFYEFWKGEENSFLVMEAVWGSSLEAMLERRGGFSPRQVLRAGIELAEGLLQLHERPEKYLFLDVKPANIVIRQDGRIKLLDLGCVCSLEGKPAFRAGTPGYAAPEQLAEKGELTFGCDVYGLGRTLEAMLGKRGEKRREKHGEKCRERRREKHGEKCRERRREKCGKKRRERRGEKCREWRRAWKKEKKLGRELRRTLEVCCRKEAAGRISNMRDVMRMFAALEKSEDNAWRQEAVCRKNIWESMYKRP